MSEKHPGSPAEGGTPAVEVLALTKAYGKVEALRGVDLAVGRGEMFALLGPNGAGKTTLFSILATLRSPSSGTARVLGRDVVKERDPIRRETGIVFQEPAIEQRLSGRDNLMLMGLLYGLSLRGARRGDPRPARHLRHCRPARPAALRGAAAQARAGARPCHGPPGALPR
jgi:ABC-type Fe3+/spermidine/putrescine transport system ATPase subunit